MRRSSVTPPSATAAGTPPSLLLLLHHQVGIGCSSTPGDEHVVLGPDVAGCRLGLQEDVPPALTCSHVSVSPMKMYIQAKKQGHRCSESSVSRPLAERQAGAAVAERSGSTKFQLEHETKESLNKTLCAGSKAWFMRATIRCVDN